MSKETLIKYGNFAKIYLINWDLNIGDIVEIGLKACNLIIYDIKEAVLSNPTNSQTYKLGDELTKFTKPINVEYIIGNKPLILTFIAGERDMNYVTAYNNYLQEKLDMELARSLDHEYNSQIDDDNDVIQETVNGLDSLFFAINLINTFARMDNADMSDNENDSENNSENNSEETIEFQLPSINLHQLTHLHSLNNLESLGLIQDDVKITLTQQELEKQRHILYGKYIKTKAYQKNLFKGTTCNICLDDFQETDNIMILKKCCHYYHADCIEKWLTQNSNKCPVCKKTVSKGRPNVIN